MDYGDKPAAAKWSLFTSPLTAIPDSARTAGLDDTLGAIRPGMKADLMLLDLDDTAYLPFNSATRQLVHTETGRGIETVIGDGRIAMRNREIPTGDEDALRQEVSELMRDFIVEFEDVVRTRKTAMSDLLEARKRMRQADAGLQRFIGRTQ